MLLKNKITNLALGSGLFRADFLLVLCMFMNNSIPAQNRYKKTDYKYDLISGNVTEVTYQANGPDKFIQRYAYDADNRITEVSTSTDAVTWDKDVAYSYYQHGPLSRIELGSNKVQGLDYTYTLQGWTKSMNSNAFMVANDPGRDGLNNMSAARDLVGFSLGYYKGDYSSISNSNSMLANINSSPLDAANSSLYNGNIRHMVTSIRQQVGGNWWNIHGNAYRYDQLSRLDTSTIYSINNDGSTNNFSGATANTQYKESFKYDGNGNLLKLMRNGSNGQLAMDNLRSQYASAGGKVVNNRLLHVNDSITSAYTTDIDNQGAFNEQDKSSWNYQYDAIGNLISDRAEQIGEIVWNSRGKITAIKRTAGSTLPELAFDYDASGNRIAKIEKPYNELANPSKWTTTYYVLDANGRPMAIYEKRPDQGSLTVFLKESVLYGSKRLGAVTRDLDVTNPAAPLPMSIYNHSLGLKQYELSNHLGNVLATISDNRIQKDDNADGTTDYYTAKIISATDYYAFGSPMPDRSFNSANYRYGFNGKEKDDKVKGSGNSLDFGERIYDSRLGRWLSIDPLVSKYPNLSPYNFSGANPILYIDEDGRDFGLYIDHKTKTIVVKSTIHTIAGETAKVAEQAASKWNNESGKYTYMVGKGKAAKNYTITFDIKVKAYSSEEEMNSAYHGDQSGEGNKLTIVPVKDQPGKNGLTHKGTNGGGYNRITITNDDDGKGERTGAHEVGHTLGLRHFNAGLMIDGGKTTGNKSESEISPNMVGKILSGAGMLDYDPRSATDKQVEPSDGGVTPKTYVTGKEPAKFKSGVVRKKEGNQ
jgi:RHS repeat-associated protein